MNDSQLVCQKCGSIIAPDENFCSNCGTILNAGQSQTIGIGKQIWIYLVSFLLPPLGLVWVFKYVKSDNQSIRRVGWIAFILTIVAIVLTVWVTMGFFQGLQNQLNSYSNLGL